MSAQATDEKYTMCPDATPANRFCLDYEAEAAGFADLPYPIIDVHTHVGGVEATKIYRRASELYGVGLTYSMTQLEELETVREIMGGNIRFIAVPNYRADDLQHSLGQGFHERIPEFAKQGVKICKFWTAPRSRDYGEEFGDPEFMSLTNPLKLKSMELAAEEGMCFMVHVADPDTWFATKYADAKKYGTKRGQYDALEFVLERFGQPWIAAHCGGWPEDLHFLTEMLERHENLYLDTSATKWIIREISKHPREEVIEFLARFRGRILFGSDIVTSDDHLQPDSDESEQQKKASSPAEAFDLYASRFWALRMLWESDFDGESPIADPDLHMVDPERHDEMDAPPLRGKSLPPDLLRSLYHDAARDLLEPMHSLD